MQKLSATVLTTFAKVLPSCVKKVLTCLSQVTQLTRLVSSTRLQVLTRKNVWKTVTRISLLLLVVVRAVKGKLEATLDQKVNNIQNGNVTITVPANGKIRSLDASSASKIIGETTLKAGKFSIEASSAAKIKAAVEAVSCTIETSSASKVEASVEAESCSLDASSASKIILEGSAGTFRADMSSASKLNAEKFSAVNATIDTSSAASASIDCSGKLTASASSGSSVRYSGDCQTSLEKSSGGSIRKL